MTRRALLFTPLLLHAVAEGDSYAIYNTLIRERLRTMPEKAAIAIANETESGRGLRHCLRPAPEQESIYRPIIDDFERASATALKLERKFDLPFYTLIPPDKKQEWWQSATKGQFKVVFEVSAVGYNSDRTRALTYLGLMCGSLCGRGGFYVMRKRGAAWESDTDYRGAPGCVWAA